MDEKVMDGLIFRVEASPRARFVGGQGVRFTMFDNAGQGTVYDVSPGTADAIAEALATVARRVVEG